MLIYKITNKQNNKVYIGQTTQTLERRITNYKSELKWFPDRRPIIRAMSKYGFNNFTFTVLQDNIQSKQYLDEREKYYIKYYHSLVTEQGYNVELGGNSAGKHSEETKKKISQAQLGEKNHMYGKTGALNATSKKVLELTTGITYDSASLAANKLGLNFSHVCAVARGTRGSHKGYVFRYLDENGAPIQNSSFAKIKFTSVKENILPQYKYLISC